MRSLRRSRSIERTERERGAVLVEAAAVFPVLFMLVVGMVTAGLALSQRNSIENAARETSRFGATHPVSSVNSWLDDVSAVAEAASGGDLEAGVPDRYICVALVNSSSDGIKIIDGSSAPVYSTSGTCPGTTCPSSSAPCVQVVLRRSATLDAVAFKQHIGLESTNVSAFERES